MVVCMSPTSTPGPVDETPEERAKRLNRERAKRWYAANGERARANGRAWREAHPEQIKEREAERYRQERDKRLAYAADPERRRKKAERMRASRAADPELSRLRYRAWAYGLTVQQVRALLANGCDVCGATERLHIDHDHACCPTGRSPRSCGRCVRGVLCHHCNTAMGLLGESEERVTALLHHLQSRAAAEETPRP